MRHRATYRQRTTHTSDMTYRKYASVNQTLFFGLGCSNARFLDNVARPESPFVIELRLIDGDLFHKEVVNNKLMVDFI